MPSLVKWSLSTAMFVGLIASSAHAVEFEMSNEFGPGTPAAETDAYFAERVSENTDGGVKINVHLGGALGFSGAGTIEAVRDGVIQMGSFPIPSAIGIDRRFMISSLPFVAGTPEETAILQDVVFDEMSALLDAEDQKLLYMMSYPAIGLWSRSPITSLDDFKGTHIRSYDPIGVRLLQSVGAAPIQLTWVDMIPQAQAGAIEMIYTTIAGGPLGNLWEFMPNFLDLGVAMSINVTTMNNDVFNSLSEEEREGILDAAAQTQAWSRQRLVEYIDETNKLIEGHGTVIVNHADVPEDIRAAFLKQSEPIIRDWIAEAGEEGRVLLNTYLEKVGRPTF